MINLGVGGYVGEGLAIDQVAGVEGVPVGGINLARSGIDYVVAATFQASNNRRAFDIGLGDAAADITEQTVVDC